MMNARKHHHPNPLRALAIVGLALLCLAACAHKGNTVDQQHATAYGTLPDGDTARLYTLTNANGLTATLTDFGAILVSLKTPDREGNFEDITLGYDTLEGWVNDPNYMGATVGRYGNRIDEGTFTLDGTEYQLATNNGPNHIHGGDFGFNKRLWDADPFDNADAQGVRFTYVSPDGEEGYPGKLTSVVTYTLNNNDELIVTFEATTNEPTIVNLVHHTYWNLTGDPNRTILDHKLLLLADRYVPTDATGIPNKGFQPVEKTPMDFGSATRIGERINHRFGDLNNAGGYDHSWVVNGKPGTLRLAAVAYDPDSGRVMQIETDQPGIQFYSGNFMDGSTVGKAGVPHRHRTGLCLETQVFPDSPNQPELSNAVLRPGETYRHTMVHRFRTK